MDYSLDSQDPLQINSQSTENIFSEDESLSIVENSPISSKTHLTSSINSNPSTSIFNKEDYKLENDLNSKIYIFSNKLFSRSLLPINLEKDREILISYTR
jgi:hypothetical protein